jgi:hypothetical protein
MGTRDFQAVFWVPHKFYEAGLPTGSPHSLGQREADRVFKDPNHKKLAQFHFSVNESGWDGFDLRFFYKRGIPGLVTMGHDPLRHILHGVSYVGLPGIGFFQTVGHFSCEIGSFTAAVNPLADHQIRDYFMYSYAAALFFGSNLSDALAKLREVFVNIPCPVLGDELNYGFATQKAADEYLAVFDRYRGLT